MQLSWNLKINRNLSGFLPNREKSIFQSKVGKSHAEIQTKILVSKDS